MVKYKVAEIRTKFDWMLAEDSLRDSDRFARAVYAVTYPAHKDQVLELAVHATLSAAVSWEFRFVQPTTSFPLLLVYFAEKPHDEVDHRRWRTVLQGLSGLG